MGDFARLPVPPSRHGGRKLEERLAMRLPSLAHVVRSAVLRRPPASRLRRAVLPRSIRTGFDAANRKDYEAMVIHYDRDVEVHLAPEGAPEHLIGLDLDEHYRGQHGWLRFMESWYEAWEEWRVEREEVIDFGDRYLVLSRMSGRGKGSGVELEQPLAQLFTLRGGRVARLDYYWRRDVALRDLRLLDGRGK